MPQTNEVVNLWLYFDEWSRCISSRYQRDSLYRFGKFDGCSPQYSDLKTAVKAKMMSDEGEARRMESTTYYRKNLGSAKDASPTAGVIWELKDPTGWDVQE
mmetsp:Transcript_34489/g.75494  ORF Transcript_34489/g.75494 Transcript_34489/m.75494 type:complete len:101 (-) Transcript_34489:270-572(-)|eukprot:CAMPEP_0178547550 /NCGR_PEP_ID=MMETSP0697-20121206/4737_1 /TAXON_ID=265572 /ORGANISM="Extubocellulus spinifer, Strain CCMP396" /LENGTH=100 /DNA_ID=CAMNT_0020180195 /DNA_START=194 /DNA_END=496 /DNA_ORIENTATION=-